MKETARIIKLYDDLYQGSPWLDINLADTLKNISAEQAFKKISPSWNSIWEILNHIISWRLAVLERLHGKITKSPANNYFEAVKDNSEAAWKASLRKLEDSQKQWTGFLKNFNENDFDEIYPGNEMNYYDHIHGILHHDAYHLGQIVLLAK